MTYLIIGLGQTGLSLANHFTKIKQPFKVFDTRAILPNHAVWKESFPNHELNLANIPSLRNIELIVVSPGVDPEHEIFKQAKDKNIPICGDLTIFFKNIKAPVIAITGTNGKSTVTSLVGQIFKGANLKVGVAGNIGKPVLDCLYEVIDPDVWVLELSSFQLELMQEKLHAGTILNISPDHLDRHKTMENYSQAKHKIYENTKYCIFNLDDLATKPKNNKKEAISFGCDAKKATWGLIKHKDKIWLAKNSEPILCTDNLKIKGMHNWINALAAAALAETMAISIDKIKNGLRLFSALPYRCEPVLTKEDLCWINDSKGTNVGSTLAALQGIGQESFPRKLILIAGGIGKDADFSLLKKAIVKYVRYLILLGRDAKEIAKVLPSSFPILYVQDLKEAVKVARFVAKPEDTILFSPACASFDMFLDYNHRGEVFNGLVIENDIKI